MEMGNIVYRIQEPISTIRFGTSMSAHRILPLESVGRVWLFAN